MIDFMKLNFGSKFMRKIMSKLMRNWIRRQIGYKVDLNLDELNITFEDGDVNIKTKLELKMDAIEFTRIMKGIEKELDKE